jgi:lysozyme
MDVARLKADLLRDEALRVVVYDDGTGRPLKAGGELTGHASFGVGHNGEKPLSLRAVQVILEDDIADVTDALDRALPWWRTLSENRQRALANMAFNLGIVRLLGFRDMLACLEAGDWKGAAAASLDSRWAVQVGERARRIAQILEEG